MCLHPPSCPIVDTSCTRESIGPHGILNRIVSHISDPIGYVTICSVEGLHIMVPPEAFTARKPWREVQDPRRLLKPTQGNANVETWYQRRRVFLFLVGEEEDKALRIRVEESVTQSNYKTRPC
ncbi:unnamed protein product [Arabis nemorensis]|uniref:Uncharacterized protein n=1 Tax=Arabis nemorensis TaxID=586526 RepID=A0A565B4Z1_9BRAS|nr:unnamed protein product [Arabis nemorensis]